MSANPILDDRTDAILRRATTAARSGRVKDARRIAETGLADGCDSAALHALMGWLLVREGEFATAVVHLEQAREDRPQDSIIVRNLATALVGCERYGEAIEALSATPDSGRAGGDLQRLRGYAAQMSGDLSMAIDAYERVVKIEPLDWETWNNLGNARVGAGDHSGGIAALGRAAALNSRSGPTRLNLARALRQAGEFGEAAAQLRSMANDFPSETTALIDLATLLGVDLGDDQGALRALEQAVERSPNDVGLLVNLGHQQLLALAIHEAEVTFERALSLDPMNMDAFLGLAEALEHGRPDGLPDLVARAEAAHIGEAPLAFLRALTAWREHRHEAGIRALRQVPEDFEPERRWHLEGQLLDAEGQCDAAFLAFTRMNAAHAADPSQPVGRAAELRRRLQEQLDLTTQAWHESWAAPPMPAERAPVFLLGFPRSGTTLLDTMLMGHRQIQVMEERPIMARLEAEIGGFKGIAALGEDGVRKARKRYFEMASGFVGLRDDTILVDKSPLHLQRLPQIVRLFPEARVILALRHPADVVLSCFMSSFRLNASMANFLDLETAAEFYDLSFKLWENARGLFPVEVRTVIYEEMIEEPEAALRPIIESLGLFWDSQVLDHQRTARTRGVISTASYAQVTKPLYTDARGRWHRYRRHLEPVLPILAPWIRKFGYGL